MAEDKNQKVELGTYCGNSLSFTKLWNNSASSL